MANSELAIVTRELVKYFEVPEREAGLGAALRSLVKRKNREVRAVDGISFDVAHGEVVGFLGPNGAGKTTTLKMLAGLLYPTSGEVQVLGFEPSRRQNTFLRQITLIMGQRNQLVWDIPAIDSFELNRMIYQVPYDQYKATRDELVELLDLGDLTSKPVRNLSLGERMKVEIAASLLHRPKVLFLDEPTIGLDVTMQRRIRRFVAEYNRRYDATVLLTSHYMADVEALCERVIVIDRGRILFDGALAEMRSAFSVYKTIRVTLASSEVALEEFGEVVSRDGNRVVLRVPKEQTAEITARLLAAVAPIDLTVEDPPVDDVIEHVFGGQTKAPSEVADGQNGVDSQAAQGAGFGEVKAAQGADSGEAQAAQGADSGEAQAAIDDKAQE